MSQPTYNELFGISAGQFIANTLVKPIVKWLNDNPEEEVTEGGETFGQ